MRPGTQRGGLAVEAFGLGGLVFPSDWLPSMRDRREHQGDECRAAFLAHQAAATGGTSLWMLTGGEVFVALGAHDPGGTLSAEWANRTEREPRAAAEVTKSWSDNLPIRAI